MYIRNGRTSLWFGTTKKKIEVVPLSNDTIHSRISDMSTNILEQIIAELDSTTFSLSMQLDESTDISQCIQLLVFVRYIYSGTCKEEFLFCEPLLKTTKAIDVFEMIINFFSKHKLNYKKNSVCCTPMVLLRCLVNHPVLQC